MTADIENIYLRGLREIMGELGYIRRDMTDVKARLSSIERGMGEVQMQLGIMNGRMDSIDSRVERLEKQAGLVGGLREPTEPFIGPKT